MATTNTGMLVAAAIAVIIIVGVAFVLTRGGGTQGGNTIQTTSPTTAQTTVSSGGITVTETEYSITPSVINATPGQTLTLNIKNAGTVDHGFVIQGTSVNIPLIAPGNTQSVTFTVPSAGSYSFYCPVDSHKGLGMQGTLVVAQTGQTTTTPVTSTAATTAQSSTVATTSQTTTGGGGWA